MEFGINPFKYGDQYYGQEFYLELFIVLKQKKLIVDEYTDQFQELHVLCRLYENPTRDLPHYIRALRANIRKHRKSYIAIHEAYQYAIRVGHRLKQSHTRQLKSQGGKCQSKESKKEIINAIDGENVEDDFVDSPHIFDSYMVDDCQEIEDLVIVFDEITCEQIDQML